MTRLLPFAAVALLVALTADATPQPPAKPTAKPKPKFEVVAETRLLMEALVGANYRGVGRQLAQPRLEDQAWIFVRGQALLIAESGNLLLMRPPKSGGTDEWMELATELRDRGTKLAKATQDKDAARSRAALSDLTTTCNRCHKLFNVPVPVRVPTADDK